MMRLLLILLAFYPATLSLSTSEATPGALVVATISAPAGAAVSLQAPAFVTVGPVVYLGGETYRAELRVAPDAPLAREPVTIGLRVDGVLVSSARLRVWTDGVVRWRVWLPWIAKAPAGSAPGRGWGLLRSCLPRRVTGYGASSNVHEVVIAGVVVNELIFQACYCH